MDTEREVDEIKVEIADVLWCVYWLPRLAIVYVLRCYVFGYHDSGLNAKTAKGCIMH